MTDALQSFKPLRAVHGNIDDKQLQALFPADQSFVCEGMRVFMTHIAGKPPAYNARVVRQLKSERPDILIGGHSHILLIRRDPAFGNMLFINPGAAGHHGFHKMRTLVRFEITHGALRQMEVIELGRRGALPRA